MRSTSALTRRPMGVRQEPYGGLWPYLTGLRCAGCGAPGSPWCSLCADSLLASTTSHRQSGAVERLTVLAADTGPVGRLVRRWKDGPDASLSGIIAGLGRVAAASLPSGSEPSMVTWVPSARGRRRSRGFEPGRVVAGGVGRHLGVRPVRLLRRLDSATQRGRDASHRQTDIRISSRGRVMGDVLLVDDVVTTGASMQVAADALRRSGARRVTGLAILQRSLKG